MHSCMTVGAVSSRTLVAGRDRVSPQNALPLSYNERYPDICATSASFFAIYEGLCLRDS